MDALADSGQLSAVDHCDAQLARARALADLGDAPSAEAQAEAVQSIAAEAEHVAYMVLGSAARARAMAAGGRRADAEEQLESARQVLSRHSVRALLGEAVDRAAAEVAILSGDRVAARRTVERLAQGRNRDLMAIRVLAMGGGLSEADVVHTVQRVRPESPREVVHARLLMAALTAASRRAEASMHLRAAAGLAHEHGMLLALQGSSEEVLVLAEQTGIRRCGPGRVIPRGRAAAPRRTAGARCGRAERGGAPAPRPARGVPERIASSPMTSGSRRTRSRRGCAGSTPSSASTTGTPPCGPLTRGVERPVPAYSSRPDRASQRSIVHARPTARATPTTVNSTLSTVSPTVISASSPAERKMSSIGVRNSVCMK